MNQNNSTNLIVLAKGHSCSGPVLIGCELKTENNVTNISYEDSRLVIIEDEKTCDFNEPILNDELPILAAIDNIHNVYDISSGFWDIFAIEQAQCKDIHCESFVLNGDRLNALDWNIKSLDTIQFDNQINPRVNVLVKIQSQTIRTINDKQVLTFEVASKIKSKMDITCWFYPYDTPMPVTKGAYVVFLNVKKSFDNTQTPKLLFDKQSILITAVEDSRILPQLSALWSQSKEGLNAHAAFNCMFYIFHFVLYFFVVIIVL